MDRANWDEVRACLLAVLEGAVAGLAEAVRDDRVRAVALHGVDAEEDGPIGTPLLAVDTAGALSASRAEATGFWSARFNPEDFAWPEADAPHEPLLEIERAVTAEACRGDTAHWYAVLARYEAMLVEVAGALARRVPEVLPVTPDFVAYVFDPAGGPDLARRTIPDDLFARHFPEQVDLERQREAIAALDVERRVAFLLSRLAATGGITGEEAGAALVALGEPAVDGLVGLLGDPERGWRAAQLLGAIGLASDRALAGLRGAVAANGPAADWSARALGGLGDSDHLLGLAGEAATARFAALGVTARLLAWYPGHPLDYGPLERLIERGGPAAERAGQDLAPGRSLCSISAADVPAALAGLSSPHRVVRSHAARVLGNPKLGTKWAVEVIEALVETALRDGEPEVRRLAALAVKGWKKRAAPHLDRLAPLLDDPDEKVRAIASYVMGGRG